MHSSRINAQNLAVNCIKMKLYSFIYLQIIKLTEVVYNENNKWPLSEPWGMPN